MGMGGKTYRHLQWRIQDILKGASRKFFIYIPGVPERTGAFKNDICHDLLGQITHSTHHCVAHSMLFYMVTNILAFVPYLSLEQITSAEAAQARAPISGWVGIKVLSHRPTTGDKIGTYSQNYFIVRPLH